MKSLINKFLDAIYPPVCVNCKNRIEKQENILCEECFNLLHINSSLFCPRCMARKTTLTNTCHQEPFILAPATFYHDPIPAIIHYYKYKNMKSAKKILSAILITYLKNLNLDLTKFYISYIPLHKRKGRLRGFNQSKELAETISYFFNLPMIESLVKITNNKPQAKTKSHQERAENVKNTFKVKNPEQIKNKNIILVDDVSTSGATLYEASALLKKYGVRKIIGLVVSKAQQ